MVIETNWCRCTSCHAGYGWKDKTFDFSSEENVDCLVCHDTTGTYKKVPTDCGHPAYEHKVVFGKEYPAVDLGEVARKVGRTSRATCGACHFYGGGGDGVKHGDLDSSLLNPGKDLDVHMDSKGLNYSCSTCHRTFSHLITGRHYFEPAPGLRRLALPRDDGNRLACESCHGPSPHKNGKLNHHTDVVACQSCHIPAFARVKPTVMRWDWSVAGRLDENGKPIGKKGPPDIGPNYFTKKGEQIWAKDVTPVYLWYDGTFHTMQMGDKIGVERPVVLSGPNGRPGDPNSRIFPFKIHKGVQPYDPVNMIMGIPKLFGPKGSGAYWSNFDWKASLTAGMASAGLPFSGEVKFIETITYWPINHMVAPKEKAVSCASCHARNGLMAGIDGVYIPGRDRNKMLDMIGWTLVALSLAGVGIHGVMRVVLRKERR